MRSLIGSSLDYELTWSVYSRHDRCKCDWRVDPYLVVVYSPEASCKLAVQGVGGIEKYIGRPGDAFLIPAGTTHEFYNPSCLIGGVGVHYKLFNFVDVPALYRVPRIVSGDDAVEIGETICKLVEIVGQIPNPRTHTGSDKLNFLEIVREREVVFELLGRVLQVSEMLPNGRERLFFLQKIHRSLHFIEENLESKVSVEKLGEISGVSAHRFGVIFRDVMGTPPHQYILRRRIDKAMEMLSSSETLVVDIAGQLGFHDQPHFTRLFKSSTGVSPTFYRKNFRRRFSVTPGHSETLG